MESQNLHCRDIDKRKEKKVKFCLATRRNKVKETPGPIRRRRKSIDILR
jgi:hypothetical protein